MNELTTRSDELMTRLLTAIILIPVALYAVFHDSPKEFLFGSILLISFAAWEWAYISGYTSYKTQACYVVLACLSLILTNEISSSVILVLSGLTSLCIIVYIGRLIVTQAPLPIRRSRALTAGFGLLCFVLFFRSWMMLKLTPPLLGIGLLLIIMTDTLGYFVGRYYGKHLLIPNISPKKTWEGFLASLLSPFILVGLSFKIPMNYSKSLLFLAGLFTVLAAIAGDLLESLLKRQQNVKDSGSLLPGHGGVLDRLDSLLIAIPTFASSLYGLHLLLAN